MHKFLNFLDSSPTAWHAVEKSSHILIENGFEELLESVPWDLNPGGRYFTTRQGATLAAWIQPKEEIKSFIICASHTDSPSLKLKPHAEYYSEGLTMLGVEVYGGPLLNSWLNRDLGIAGQISYIDERGKFKTALVNIDDAPVTVAQLAIHLDREISKEGLKLNKQEHLNAIAGTKPYLIPQLQKQIPFKKLLAHDLFLYPLEKARKIDDLVASYRIDNLSSAYCTLEALTSQEADTTAVKMLIMWDHEEIGSATERGASSPFAAHLLERIAPREALSESLCISCDSAHAVHPNYRDRHEVSHRPQMGKGPVIKWNSQKRYATDAKTAGILAFIAEKSQIELQQFVVRSDMPCGSTIGPLHATATGVPTVDIGIPQLSMHSARELASLEDLHSLTKLLSETLSNFGSLNLE